MVTRAPKGPAKTVQDWLALPDYARTELIDGELVEKAYPKRGPRSSTRDRESADSA